MQALIELAGYTDYQATCLSPVLWALAAFALASLLAGWWCDRIEKRARARRRAIQRRRRHGRR